MLIVPLGVLLLFGGYLTLLIVRGVLSDIMEGVSARRALEADWNDRLYVGNVPPLPTESDSIMRLENIARRSRKGVVIRRDEYVNWIRDGF